MIEPMENVVDVRGHCACCGSPDVVADSDFCQFCLENPWPHEDPCPFDDDRDVTPFEKMTELETYLHGR